MRPADSPSPPQRVVLVTGAAGGLGRELVAEFSSQGWRVLAGSHRGPIAGVESEMVSPVQLDVTSRAHVEAVIEEIAQRCGRLDALVCNAGVTADGPLARMADHEWDHVLQVNLTGAFHCSRAALRLMLPQRDGHIIHISSYSGRVGARGQTNYAAAKAGLLGLTQALAKEVGGDGIHVNAVLPGVLPTPMTASLGAAAMAEFAQANTLGRINSPDEVARFIAFLATTRNISGQVFQLDSRIAGWT